MGVKIFNPPIMTNKLEVNTPVSGINYGPLCVRCDGDTRGIAIEEYTGGETFTLSLNSSGDFQLLNSTSVTPEFIVVDATNNVIIGNGVDATSAILQLNSTTKAFLPPRMTEAQRDAIATPIAGMIIYNSTTNVLNFYNGAAWGAI